MSEQQETAQITSNSINYTCPCGKTWTKQYTIGKTVSAKWGERSVKIAHLTRMVDPSEMPIENDAQCSCGQIAEGSIGTPMPGYTHIRVKLLALETIEKEPANHE